MKIFKKIWLSVVAVLLVVLSLFLITSCSRDNNADEQANADVEETTENKDVVLDENEDVTKADEPKTTVISDEEVSTSADKKEEVSGSKTDVTVKEDKKQLTTEQIVEIYNSGANAVKKDAEKVVKNFEKRSIGELKLPDALQSTAEKLLPNFIKDDTEPIVYATKEEIKTEFIVPNQSYVSRLTANDVEKATCTDNGKEYIIYIKVKDEKNPASGKGVGAAFDVIEAADVAQKAPSFVKELSTYYTDCEIKATIDKATGKMTHAVYSTPVKLYVVVELFGTHNVTANFKYVKDYSVTY